MKKIFLCTVLLSLAGMPLAECQMTGCFAPPAGKVLVFAGQDNASVGGTEKYSDGYVDNVSVPAGITHYIYFAEGWKNDFGRTFPVGEVAGLNSEIEWASGPMCLKSYLDSPALKRCVMHVSIAMEGNSEDKVADGSFDHLISQFVAFVANHPEHPFLIRIGYEFDGSWNDYDPQNFKKAFRRIVDALRAKNLTNFATVFASSSSVKAGQFEEYDPGSSYYDWVGYSWWGGDQDGGPALDFARKVGKPVFIAEATPRGHYFDKENHDEIWRDWFEKFFSHIDQNKDVIRAISYINADWDAQDMWDGWGQTRIETAPSIKERWLKKLATPTFINAVDKPFEHIGFPPSQSQPQVPVLPYKDASLPIEQRVDDLLGRMSLQEKVAQMTGWWHYDERRMRDEGSVFKPEFYAEKCPNGIGEIGPLHNLSIEEDARMYAAVQEYFRKKTRLGIPAILHDEAAHGFMRVGANSFPTPIGLSCTWNPALLVELYSQAAKEARSRGISHILSPIVDVARELRWGRVDETLGEDSFLAGRLGAAMVQGLQGSDDGSIAPDHVAATLKHFAGYASTEGGRNRSPYSHGPRHLLDTDVAPFRYVIQTAKPASVMAAFNEIDGLPCHVNPWILTDVLRNQIGFTGLVVGDYQGLDLVRQYQGLGSSDADVGRMALEAGLQLELPNNFGFKHLPQLLQNGRVSVHQINTAVRAILSLKFRLGLFEAPFEIDTLRAESLVQSPKATALIREAARQSMVLLKNDANLLPLQPGVHKKIAVIGPNANVCRLGNYSGKPVKTVSLFEGIRDYLGDRAQVVCTEGCKIANNDTAHSYDNWRYINEIDFATVQDNQVLIDQAVEVASDADLVVLALGENVLLSREAWAANHAGDRTTFDLTESQVVLAESVLATGKPVILFLNNSKPVTLHDLEGRIPAIITAHYAGQETGTAAAEILFGDVSPSGKLTLSWPQSVGHLPSHYSQNKSAKVFDYIDAPRESMYAFGHGLSYTTFDYGTPSLSQNVIRHGETIELRVDVTNSGSRAGAEIVQLYVSGQEFPLARPDLELKGFRRVYLEPNETRTVAIELEADDLHFHDYNLQRTLPDGKYLVFVGGSTRALSEPITLKTKRSSAVAYSGVVASGVRPANASKQIQGSPVQIGEPLVDRPNVLFIAIDDLRPELGTYGANAITPHIDQLARTGFQFDRAYCQQAVCGASRLSIMGGLYPTLTQEQTFHVSGWRERHPHLLTINQHFGKQGYQTIGLGKIYHGHKGAGVDPAHWGRWIEVDADDYARPENVQMLAQARHQGQVGNALDPPKGPTTESADVADDTYIDGKRAIKAVEVINDLAAQKGRPFFLAVGLSKPHLPFVAPQKYWDLYDRKAFSMPSNGSIPPGYPPHAANLMAHEMQKYSDFEGSSPKDFSEDMNLRLLHGYAAATSYVDACLGQIMKALEQTGLSENTIVVLWGDHGWKLGDHSSWCKHTNFECDTRVPLIIRDPKRKGGVSTPRLVELIDLYPTLCDMTGIPIPVHCQGRSLTGLLDDPTAGHRLDAYSSYPAGESVGHSIRFSNFRYTEWHHSSGDVRARVLTDLKADPGEVTNVIDDPRYADDVARGVERLGIRINQSKTANASQAVSSDTIKIQDMESHVRQTVDGFGGSIAFWGTYADDQALEAAVKDLRVSIIRAQGEITKKGSEDHNRDVLLRSMQNHPGLQVLLSFWQPRSRSRLQANEWLNIEGSEGQEHYVLKPSMEDAWADEITSRVRQYLDWGINVTSVGIQNESNWSHVGTQTCQWEPHRLSDFISQKVKPRFTASGLEGVAIAAPDLAYVGPEASEVQRFLPVLMNPHVDVATYHMYDSFVEGDEGHIGILEHNSSVLGGMRREYFPKKRLWMTETTGAQWNGDEWHTYGWNSELTEHDKAIKAARYIHMTLTEAEANAFLWWGLIYSVAPDKEKNPNVRQKHRDEGLVLVQETKNDNGQQIFLERTKKFYTFRQYSAFIQPGYQRLATHTVDGLHVSAFRNPNGQEIVAVVINDAANPRSVQWVPPAGMKAAEAWQTDADRNCEAIDVSTPLAPMSVRTVVFERS